MFVNLLHHRILFALFMILICMSAGAANQIIIAANPIDGAQRAEFFKQVEAFQKLHPKIDVQLKSFEHESFKKHVDRRIGQDKPFADVLFWFGGASLRHFAGQGKLTNLSSMWDEEAWDQAFPSAAKHTVSLYGMQYGVPLYYYQWGVYYRKSIFESLGLAPPKTWGELLQVAAALNNEGVTPFTLAADDYWPSLSWFDYINLRLNGLAFHESLLNGCVAFTDLRVRNIFGYLSILRDQNLLPEHVSTLDFKGAVKEFSDKKSAMILMGNFFLASVSNRIRSDIGFVAFPVIDPDIPSYEEAPTDVLILPKNSQNKENAKLFLRFMAKPQSQEAMAKAMEIIPINRDSKLAHDEHIQSGAYLLANAKGLAQFFDRDTHPEFASKAQVIISDFIAQPDSLYEVTEKLEAIRKDIWSDTPINCR